MILSTAGASILAIAFLMPAYYLTASLFNGEKATANPWGAHGLEWQADSPPISTNFEKTPIVTDEVYDFTPTDEYEQKRGTDETYHPGEKLV
jgi:cytochrome c oxidase subunit 1